MCSPKTRGRFLHCALVLLAVAAAACSPKQAQADGKIGSLAIPGAFFATSSEAREALGSTLYYRETTMAEHSLGLYAVGVSGGIDVINATNHFVPYTGGNSLTLIGPGVRCYTEKGILRPFAWAGLYAGNLKSETRGIDKWGVTPSATVGMDLVFSRALVLRAQYRFSSQLGGINTNGASLILRVF